MTTFSSSISNCIKALKNSSYPNEDFHYEDEILEHLRLGYPQTYLIEVALYGEEPETLMRIITKEIKPISYEDVICIRNIGVRERFRNQGFFSTFMNEIGKQFPTHHLCISEINSSWIQHWVTHQDNWKMTPILLNTFSKKNPFKLVNTMRKHYAVKLAER
ncbi:hypothetical protein [Vibrio sp. TBV020]|uniref:hypothetical protein n=1 Tax=Vibrio sp. TBV020 TaxID=3137398 RepID=UPI0038CD2D10